MTPVLAFLSLNGTKNKKTISNLREQKGQFRKLSINM